MDIKSVDWVDGCVRFIDQTKLPREEAYIQTTDYRRIGEAIRKLEIRGAPAIGVAAAFGLAAAVADPSIRSVTELHRIFDAAFRELSETRPTAVNLFTALNRMQAALESLRSSDITAMRARLLREALDIQSEDEDACRRIGELGASLIPAGATILTHCNTGALATAGSGTAQGIITTAARQGKVVRVYVDETRPLFQGARLTAWELMKEGIEAVLITDSTAGFVMRQGMINAVCVGADRIAANGDVANKVGTYTLAVLARVHRIPFYVAAPVTSIDHATPSGKGIPVEERSPWELTHVGGAEIAAPGVKVYAPAFDVVPHQYLTAIITEKKVLLPPFKRSIASLRSSSRAGRSNSA